MSYQEEIVGATFWRAVYIPNRHDRGSVWVPNSFALAVY